MGTREQAMPEFTREAVQVGKSGSRSASELARELVRVTEERDMLQKAAAYFAMDVR
jgi:transposase-like protein